MKSWDDKYIIIAMENCNACSELIKQAPSTPFIKFPDQSLGLGDTIAKITFRLNIDQCEKCKIRHYWLNRLFPYWWRSSKLHREIRTTLLKKKHLLFPVVMTKDFREAFSPDEFIEDFTSRYHH